MTDSLALAAIAERVERYIASNDLIRGAEIDTVQSWHRDLRTRIRLAAPPPSRSSPADREALAALLKTLCARKATFEDGNLTARSHEEMADAILADGWVRSSGAPPQKDLLAKIGARVLQQANLSAECSDALIDDVISDIMMRGVIAREAHRKIAFGDHRVREG